MKDKEQGERVKGKQPCIKCKSSDAVSIYQKPDDTFDGHCFSCESFITPYEVSEHYNLGEIEEEEVSDFDPNFILNLPMRGWRERRVGRDVTELYGVRSEITDDGTMIKRYYPVTEDEELVGYHVRDCIKKGFYTEGKNRTKSEFFGQSLFPCGGKFLAICGGEEDAMSLQQALKFKNPKFTTAVVSPTNGESSTAAQIKANYEWVTSFEKVILMLDNDEPGRKATEEALKLLKPGQGYTAKLALKDPNEYLKVRRDDELVGAFWKAERHSPIDLMTLGQMWDEFEKGTEEDIIPFPDEFAQLNKMMNGGPARGEITTLGALTSIGKTSYLMKWVYHWLMNTNEKPGLLLLESTAKEIVRNLLSIHIKKNLALVDRADMNLVELKNKFMELLTDGDRVISIDHQGSFTSADELFQKVEWMVMAMDVSVVLIDPLQQAVPSNENNVIDEFQDKLLKLAKKTNAAIFVVSHMRKPEGKDPHDVSEYNLKGSSSINQVSFNTILMSRDKTAKSDNIRNCTRFVLVKCRRTGETGEAGWVRFYPETMEFKAVPNPYEDLAEADEDLEAIYGE